jgi:hypothetical protein
VADGKCAAARDHRGPTELQEFIDQRRLFVNARVSVLIAVNGVSKQRNRPELFINGSKQSHMDHQRTLRRIVCASALFDVRGFKRVVAAESAFMDDSFALYRIVVRAFKEHMCGIVMKFAERDFEFFCDVRVESGGEHEAEYGPVITLGLLIGGDVLVDDLLEFDSFKHGRDHGQLSRISTLNILRFSMTSECAHALSLAV